MGDAVVGRRQGDLPVCGRVAIPRDQIDDAEERPCAVEGGARPPDDLDALNVVDVRSCVVSDVRGPDVVVVRGLSIHEDEHPRPVAARGGESTETHRLVARVVGQEHAANAANGLRDGGIRHGSQLASGDDRNRARCVLHHLGDAGSRGDFLDGNQVGVDVSLAVGRHLDAPVHRTKALARDRHVVNTHGERQRGRRQSPLAAIDRHEGVSHFGGDQERSRDRREVHGDGLRGAGTDEHGHRFRLVPARRHEQRVATRRHRGEARDRADGVTTVVVDSYFCAGRAAFDAQGAHDLLELQDQVCARPGLEVLGFRLRRLVAGQVREDDVLAGRKAHRGGGVPPGAEVSPRDVDRRARRITVDLQHGNERLDAGDGLGDARLRRRVLLAGQRLVVVAIRVRVLTELLVGAGDVEDDVAVRGQPVGRQEVLERAAKVSALVPLSADLELELGLVGEVVRMRNAPKGESGHDCDARYRGPQSATYDHGA